MVPSPRAHVGQHGADESVRAVDVHVELVVDLLGRHVLDGAHLAVAGVVDEAVERPSDSISASTTRTNTLGSTLLTLGLALVLTRLWFPGGRPDCQSAASVRLGTRPPDPEDAPVIAPASPRVVARRHTSRNRLERLRTGPSPRRRTRRPVGSARGACTTPTAGSRRCRRRAAERRWPGLTTAG